MRHPVRLIGVVGQFVSVSPVCSARHPVRLIAVVGQCANPSVLPPHTNRVHAKVFVVWESHEINLKSYGKTDLFHLSLKKLWNCGEMFSRH